MMVDVLCVLIWIATYLAIGGVAAIIVCLSPMVRGWSTYPGHDFDIGVATYATFAWPVMLPLSLVWWAMSIILPPILAKVKKQ